jgi:hypothetical protein
MQVVELKGESITLGGPVLVNIPRLEITTREKLDRALQQRRWHVVMVLSFVLASEWMILRAYNARDAMQRALSIPAERIELRHKEKYWGATSEDEIVITPIKPRP